MQKKNLKMYVMAIMVMGVIVGSYMYRTMSERPAFTLQKVEKGNITETIEVSGKIVPQVSTDLSFQKIGKVAEIDHAVGDAVRTGDVLARLDSSEIGTQLDAANNKVTAAEAILKQYQENLKSAKYKLKVIKADSSLTYNDKKVQEKVIDADASLVDAQAAQVAAAKDNAAYYTLQKQKNNLVAPVDGIISEKNIEVGETVAVAAPVMTLISQNDYKIEAYVAQSDVSKIQVGARAKVELKASGNNDSLAAKVVSVDPAETNENGVSGYKVTLEFESALPGIRSGLSADISIALGQKNGVLVVAQKDVIQKDGQSFVMVPDARGQENLKQVQTGVSGQDNVEIVSGLNDGDQIFSLQSK